MKTWIARIYMPQYVKVKDPSASWWKKVFDPSLATFILKRAKSFQIEQCIHQPVFAGYMHKERLAYNISEVTPPSLPRCIELVDTREKIESFLKEIRNYLSECKVVVFDAVVLVDIGNDSKKGS